MNEILYWSPFISKVATVKSVINSADAVNSYLSDKYKAIIINAVNEWEEFKNELSNKNIEVINLRYDEIWISPHFEYTIDYYKYKYKTKNVKVCPYFWDPKFLQINRKQVNIISDNSRNIDIAVFEPNLYKEKSCFIPIIACEFAKEGVGDKIVKGLDNLKSAEEVKIDQEKLN